MIAPDLILADGIIEGQAEIDYRSTGNSKAQRRPKGVPGRPETSDGGVAGHVVEIVEDKCARQAVGIHCRTTGDDGDQGEIPVVRRGARRLQAGAFSS